MKINKRSLILLAIFVIGIYVLLPQISSFHASIKYLSHPHYVYLLLGLLLTFMTFFEAGLTYCLLAFKRLKLASEYIIQLSSYFINNLLPAGIGGLGANYSYLKNQKHTTSEATTVVATNNTLGLFGHFLVVLVVVTLISPHGYIPAHSSKEFVEFFKIFLSILVLVAIGSVIFGKRKLIKLIQDVKNQVISYKDRPMRLIAALLTQVTLTLSNMSALYFCTRAVGLHLSITIIILIYTLGAGVKNATPTPGGIGGYEAALLAGFVAYKVPAAHALGAVLFFRLVNFWVPLAFGFIAFIYAQKKELYSA